MSLSSLKKCIDDVREKQKSGIVTYDDAYGFVDSYNLTDDEVDALFDFISGDENVIERFETSISELDRLFNKYNVILNGKRRNYLEDLTQRDYVLENTTPVSITINGIKFENTKWSGILVTVADYLQCEYPKDRNELFDYRTEWTKVPIYRDESFTNSQPMTSNIHLNCNHTALHACWLIQDLLNFYNIPIENVEMIIHRSPYAEPKELRDALEKDVKEKFKIFVQSKYNKSTEASEKIVGNIDKALNPRLQKKSRSYPNFFLFDDLLTMYNYSKDVERTIMKSDKVSEKNKKILSRYIDYLYEFYKTNGY